MLRTEGLNGDLHIDKMINLSTELHHRFDIICKEVLGSSLAELMFLIHYLLLSRWK